MPYTDDDKGGAWVLDTPVADSCAVDAPPTCNGFWECSSQATKAIIIAGSAFALLLVGYGMGKGRK